MKENSEFLWISKLLIQSLIYIFSLVFCSLIVNLAGAHHDEVRFFFLLLFLIAKYVLNDLVNVLYSMLAM